MSCIALGWKGEALTAHQEGLGPLNRIRASDVSKKSVRVCMDAPQLIEQNPFSPYYDREAEGEFAVIPASIASPATAFIALSTTMSATVPTTAIVVIVVSIMLIIVPFFIVPGGSFPFHIHATVSLHIIRTA